MIKKTPQKQKRNNQISPRKTLLEQLYDKGWLEYRSSPYNSGARLKAGLDLIFNYQILKRANLHSGYIFNTKIDNSSSLESKMYMDSLNFYRQCLRAVPAEFWQVVRQVCLDEKLPSFNQNISERQQSYNNYIFRIDLCRGLDRIILSQLKVEKERK